MEKTPESPFNNGLALVACGLWLHIGLIGAIALAVGLLQWAEDPRLPWAPVVAFFGGMLAAASWRRGFEVLERAERVASIAANGTSASRLPDPLPDQARRKAPAVRISASIES